MAHAEVTCMDPQLYYAASKGDKESFEQGQDIQRLLTPNKNTVLHVYFTAQTVSEEFVKFIISLCPSLVLQANSEAELPLHIAARYGHLVAARLLIEGAKTLPADAESGIAAEKVLVRAKNEEGDLALHEAVRYNHIEVVSFLTKEDPDYPYCRNKDGESPLYIAAERGYRDVLREILENCREPAYKGPDGRTALHAAVVNNDEAIVIMLLEKEHLKSSIRKADKQGCLPLHLAAQYCGSFITWLLLYYDRKTAYIGDNEGRTALHWAARRYDNAWPMQEILSECPDCAEIVDKKGWNALHYALSSDNGRNGLHSFFKDNGQAVKMIMEKASLSNLYNKKDVYGDTPLHLLSSLGSKHPYLSKLIQHPRVDKLKFNKKNRTAYDIACERKDKEESNIVRNLVEDRAKNMAHQRIKIPAEKEDDDHSINKYKNDEKEDPIVKSAKDSQLVVATLIATVTFAAGFTLPGGTIDKGEHKGTSILKHSRAFQAFMLTDTLAMVLSAMAVLSHLVSTLSSPKSTSLRFLTAALMLTIAAMASMMIAFVTGTFAQLGVSSGLGIAVMLIGLFLFFVPCFLSLEHFRRLILSLIRKEKKEEKEKEKQQQKQKQKEK